MGQLHIVLFPFMAHGHMIPTLDMAKVFLSRGLKTTIIATPSFSDPINRARQDGYHIDILTVQFPPQGSSLPDNIVSADQVNSTDLQTQFFDALALLQQPVEKILLQLSPNCLISDTFLPWTADSAAKLGFPRLVFHGTSSYALCTSEQIRRHKPFKNLKSESDTFVVPNLPHRVTYVGTQVSPFERNEVKNSFTKLLEQMKVSIDRSYGVVINSFYELESEYTDHYRNFLGRKAWNIGPLLLSNESKAQAQRGNMSAIDEHECLAWLDSKSPNSVVYVCFGSIASFTPTQLREMAVGLEASGQDFIWVVRKWKSVEEEWMPEGFEERTKGRGLIIRGWAPQLMILDHPAIGAFVTHCGWNSTLEGICEGVPFVTWPIFAEQFFNEKLVTQVLKTGVSVGNKNWLRMDSEGVSSETVRKAVTEVMVGEEATEMRSRAKYYKEMARKAVEEGGSSYKDLNALIEELSVYQPPNPNDMY